MKVKTMRNSRAAAMPMPAPTPAAKWLVGVCEVEEVVEGEVACKIVGKVGVENTRELEVVVVVSIDVEKLEVVVVASVDVEKLEVVVVASVDVEELEVVVVAAVDAEKLEVVTAALGEEFGRTVEEVMAAREKIRDEVSQQSARE